MRRLQSLPPWRQGVGSDTHRASRRLTVSSRFTRPAGSCLRPALAVAHNRSSAVKTLPQIACVLLSAILLAALPAPSSAQWRPNDELREGPLGDHRAARVRELLEKGADPNVPGLGGNTAVHNAAGLAVVFLGYSRSLPLMLDHGGDPNAKNHEGNTPLHLAAGFAPGALHNNSRETVRLLLAHGADPNVPNGNGDTPLHAAASTQVGSSVIRLLVRAGADPNKANRWGDTPLHAFAKHNTDDDGYALGALLDAGSDPKAVNRKRLTPLLLYVQRNGDDGPPVTRLVAAGADPNRKAPNGDTPLHVAIHEGGKKDVVDALLAAGADPCIKDRKGLIPERHAAGGGNDYIQAVLDRAGGAQFSCGAREEERRLACAEEKGLRLDRAQRRRIQEGLAAQGFDPGPADGSFGPRTGAAISGWQRAKGEAATECLIEGQALALQGGAKETAPAAASAQAAEEQRKRDAAAEEKRKAQAAAERERKRKAEDDEAFARAKRSHTESGYRAYLESCGICGHRSEAEALLAEVTKPVWRPGDKFRDCPGCPELVVVPSGSFMMGSPGSEEGRYDSEGPVHRVTFAHPFAVGVYEVTFGEWDACVSGGGCGGYRPDDEGWGRGSRPVVNVIWEDAQLYVGWLSSKTGKEYRLLSESEWEYVARAGTRTRYWWGDAIGRNRANCHGCGSRWDREKTAPVGSFSANAFGLHDVHGNVLEWVEDCWNDSYHGAPGDGSARQSGDCALRVLRGGSLYYGLPSYLRSASRGWSPAGDRNNEFGFRVARTLD